MGQKVFQYGFDLHFVVFSDNFIEVYFAYFIIPPFQLYISMNF